MRFTIGEEVIYEGERYTISIATLEAPYKYRLLRTTADGAEVVWATADEVSLLDRYTRPTDDTQRYRGSRPKRA